MNLTFLNAKKTKFFLILSITLAVIVICQMLFVPVSGASLAESEEFMEYMEQIAEDIEEIHGDMHKVAYNLKLISYSAIAMALLMSLGVVLLFMFYRKRD